MVSPELLRRYPFFAVFSDTPLKAIANVAEEVTYEPGENLYEIDKPAEQLFLLIKGSVEHYFIIVDSPNPSIRKEFYLSDINPGDVLALSSLIEPFRHTTTARAATQSTLIRIQASSILNLGELDPKLGYVVMHQAAKSLLEKLEATRVQLAATRA
jgi:CRP/FNR family transcriptional regulator, cyclic AMP receptor protein